MRSSLDQAQTSSLDQEKIFPVNKIFCFGVKTPPEKILPPVLKNDLKKTNSPPRVVHKTKSTAIQLCSANRFSAMAFNW